MVLAAGEEPVVGELLFLGEGDQLSSPTRLAHGAQPQHAADLVDGGFGSGFDRGQDRPKATMMTGRSMTP